MSTKRIAVYLRCSTRLQKTDSQRTAIGKYLQARNWDQEVAYYEDFCSGRTSKRKQLNEMITRCRKRKVDIIVVYKFDRLFRSLKHLVTTLEELNELGISFISLQDGVDFSTSQGRLMVGIIGAIAEFEADLIRERVRDGLAAAKQNGQILGRPKFDVDGDVANLRSKGMSVRKIATALEVSKGCVQNALKRAEVRCT